MGNGSDSPAIKAINRAAIHRICSGQVILDLSSAVKELVENSLDAGATSIEISLKEYGEECFKVIDNGFGISPTNFQFLALKHHTSKISDFSDLHSLTTFGFRGEALSSLCALGKLSIETRTKTEHVGTHLDFDHSGVVTSERKTARQVGTTVSVEKLFSTLPVRSKEFSRNIRREYGKLLSLLNAYALISKGVRLLCTNTTGKNSKSLVLKTQGSSSLKDNIITVFGLNTFQCLEPLSLSISEGCTIEGYLSKPGYGSGRNLGDRQFFYVNGRPVDMPKISKVINELYKSSNSKQYPIAILNFIIPVASYDVNVTPDKRKIFFSSEGSLMLSIRNAIERIYSPHQCSYSVNTIDNPKKGEIIVDGSSEDEDPLAICELSSLKGGVQLQLASNNSLVSPKETDTVLHGSCQDEDSKQMPDMYMDGMVRVVHADVDKSEGLSVYQFKQPKDLVVNLTAKVHEKNTGHAKLVQKENSHSSSVQSSLTKFVSVNKRKYENSFSMLSEVPVLRNEISSGKDSAEMHASSTNSHACDVAEDDSLQGCGRELLQDCVPSKISKSAEVPLSGECDSESSWLTGMHDVPTSVSDFTSKSLPMKDPKKEFGNRSSTYPLSDTCDEDRGALKPCSGSSMYPLVQFKVDELKRRRQKRLSLLWSANPHYDEKKIERCYAAATLDNFQPENEEGKAHSLAAAIIELERFFKKEDFGRMQVVGQFNLGFIIGKLDQDLFIVDQHAADEKCNYERLSQSTIFNLQPLLQPIRLELSPEEEVVTSMNMEIIRKNGFVLVEDMQAPPGHHFLLKAVPFSKNMTFGAEDVKELISTLADGQGDCSIISCYRMDRADSICPSRVRAMLASRACRTSVMIGDPLTKTEMQKILNNLAGLKSPWNCPHGRPTMRHLADLTTLQKKGTLTKAENGGLSIGIS
ncbi:DNA mismatch repair protein PMS1 isoform X1 [Typha latifolia]|uniref:DNA mismatch repair protein PMS1 isoform X1 n=1 Tax=Typha latifolia TaxID=4733 RepID=UPI003C2F01AC